MSNNPKTLRMRVASQARKNKFDLSQNHISTASFMQYNVAYCTEMVPNSSIKIKMETFARMAALSSPTFGLANVKNRCFAIPIRTIFPAWNDFITDTVHVGSDGISRMPVVPQVSNGSIVDFLKANSTSFLTAPAVFDYSYYDVATSTQTWYKLNTLGKQAYKVLRSLGYSVIFRSDFIKVSYSALRLLAYARVYCDYYANSSYLASVTAYNNVFKLFSYDTSNVLALTSSDLTNIFSLVSYVNYDSDYFTSAFDRPSGPNVFGSQHSITDINPFSSSTGDIPGTSVNDNTAGNTLGVPAIVPDSNTNGFQLTQYILDSLHSLTDYMMRHQYVGVRAMDRYLARFGVKLRNEKLNMSSYIDVNTTPLKFGDVLSTADTATASLGEYAGKGIINDDGNNKPFTYETDEYCILLVISTIIPKVGYYQGLNRAVLRKDRFDFFTPEFDALGTQPILSRELYDSVDGSSSASAGVNGKIFGYAPRYADYKVCNDIMSGDFLLGSVNAGKEAWHLMRMFEDSDFSTSADIVHSRQFVVGSDANQYNRIFYGSGYDNDKINIIYGFNVELFAPMKSLYDTYDYHEGSQDITMDINGNHVN